MKSIVEQINSINYRCEKPSPFSAVQSSCRGFNNKNKVNYVLWRCLDIDNIYKSHKFADQLNCYIYELGEFRNNCGRNPTTQYFQDYLKYYLYTLNTARKCPIDWTYYPTRNYKLLYIFNNNSLKIKNYHK